jgi:NDP-sugar pyrophosphorylase family protein
MKRIREAVILAAGLGTRMRPITEEMPKAAIPFLNRPILHWLLQSLEGAGVERTIINLHHLPQAVTTVAESYGGGMELRFSFEPEILGTAGLFHPIRGLIQGEAFLVCNGDIYHAIPYDVLEEKLLGPGGPLAVLALRAGNPDYTGVSLGNRGEITAFGQGETMFAGVYAARSELLRYLPPPGFRELVPDLLRPLLPSGSVRGFVWPGTWFDLGCPKAFLEASMRALEAMAAGTFDVPAESRLETRDGWPLLRHERAWVSRDATLTGPVVAGDSSRVESRAHLGRAVLLSRANLHRGETLNSAMMSSGHRIKIRESAQ